MSNHPIEPRSGERGFTLVEMLIAAAIFAIAASVAFILYTAAQKSYKMGQNFTDQQQSTRAAFDRVLSDIRNAGYNYNPDGSKVRPDEQIEAAFDTAIVVRSDIDFDDPVLNLAPETDIEGVFNAVTTGNDEVVAYVLAKPGWTGGNTMTFEADIDNPTRSNIVYLGNNISVGPRDGTVEPIWLAHVALVQNDPPYTLYRVTLNNDMASYSSGANPTAAGFFVKQPVADNIRSMTFQYYDITGNLISPDTPGDASDDIGGAESSRDTRSAIRRIVVSLVGMTADPDLQYSDPAEASTSSTVHYRKFELTSEVTPENMGLTGMQDMDTTPPGQVSPAPTLCGGHCEGVLVNFTGRPASELVTTYNIGYGTSSAAIPNVVSTPFPHYEGGVADYDTHAFIRDSANFTQGSTWYFKVQGKDSSGNVGTFSTSVSSGALNDTTTPAAPASGWGTERGSSTHPAHDGAVEVHWDAVASNASGPTGCTDSDAPLIRDLAGYRLWRGATSGFTPSGPPMVDETALPAGTLQFMDQNITQCQAYYYKAAAVDRCGNLGAPSPAIPGSSDTTVEPQAPTAVSASRTSPNEVTITWTAVTQDVQSRPIQVAGYDVVMASGTEGSVPSSGSFGTLGSTTNSDISGTSTDPNVKGTIYTHQLSQSERDYLRQENNTLYYAVRAYDACPNFSTWATPAEATCTFNGNPRLSPGDGTHVAGSVPLVLTVQGGGDTYVRGRIRIPSIIGGADVYDETSMSYPFSFPDWVVASAPPGVYTVYFEVENSTGCINFQSQTLEVVNMLACQIIPANPSLSPTTGKAGGDKLSDLTFDIVNIAGKDLFLDKIDVSWTNTLGFDPLLNSFTYPTGASTPAFLWSPAAGSPAAGSFSPTLLLSQFNDGTNPINLMLDFTNSLVDKNGPDLYGELITIRLDFHDTSGGIGYCTFEVVAKEETITPL